jgi:hypothetical protein
LGQNQKKGRRGQGRQDALHDVSSMPRRDRDPNIPEEIAPKTASRKW